jgi:hypothetical protein
MTFLTPLLAGIAAAIAIPSLLILYFLKLKRRDVEVSTTLLWKKAIEDLQANAPFQRLRKNLLLLLQLLALAAALFALAQPEMKSDAAPGGRHVILIDRSASMQATDGDPDKPGTRSRLAQAKKKAIELVESLREPGLMGGEGDQAMVIAFDVAADIRQNFTTSKAALTSAIESIEAVDSSTSIREAIKLAKAYSPRQIVENVGLQAAGPPARIHIFSDGRLPDAMASSDSVKEASTELTRDDDVVFHSVGQPDSWNVGITGIRAERAFDDPTKLSIFVGLQSTSTDPRAVDVELSIEGSRAGIREARLAPAMLRRPDGSTPARAASPVIGGDREEPAEKPAENDNVPLTLIPSTGGIVFSIDRAQGGVISVRLSSPEADVLPIDDIAYLSVPPAKRLSVALVTPGNLFLREVLEGLSLARLQILAPGEAQAIFDDPRQAAEFDVIVLDRWLPTVPPPPGAKGAPAPGLPAGRFMVFGAIPPPPAGLSDLGAKGESLVVDWRRDHPVLRGIAFDSLIVMQSRGAEVSADAPVTVLATGQHGPIIAEITDAQTRALVCTFDITASTWPFDPGFVLYTAAGLVYLGNDGAAMGETLRPGDTLGQRIPPSAQNVTLGFPDKSTAGLVPTEDGRVVYGPLKKTGIYTLSWTGPALGQDIEVDGRARRALAANLLDPLESTIGAEKTLPLPSRVVAAQEGAGAHLRRLWPYLLLVALSVVLLEWWVYNRKVMF